MNLDPRESLSRRSSLGAKLTLGSEAVPLGSAKIPSTYHAALARDPARDAIELRAGFARQHFHTRALLQR